MANGKYKSLREQMGYVRAENKAQSDTLKRIDKKLDDHVLDSNEYREQQATNTEAIRTINEDKLPILIKIMLGLAGLAGAAFVSIIGALIKYVFFA